MIQLPYLREGLLRHPLDDHVLVFDKAHDRVHLLDQATALVLEGLDRGASAERISLDLEELTGTHRGKDLLTLALDELAAAELTEENKKTPVRLGDVTRRDLLRRLGTAAAIIVPTIVSLTPSTVHGQSSLGCGAPCTTTASCPGTTRPTCHCCKIGGNTDGTCSTELSGNCQPT